MLADASAVRAYESGEARELSAGYTSDLVWGDGEAPDGTLYQATMRQIRGNHIALVAQGRAGSTCRIGDSQPGSASMFTDAERTFADSGEGKAVIAYAGMNHRTATAYLGDRAPEFGPEQAGAAVRRALHQRGMMADASAAASAQLPELRRQADAAHAGMVDQYNAWRK